MKQYCYSFCGILCLVVLKCRAFPQGHLQTKLRVNPLDLAMWILFVGTGAVSIDLSRKNAATDSNRKGEVGREMPRAATTDMLSFIHDNKVQAMKTTGCSHRNLDLRSLELHQLAADRIRHNPALMERVISVLARWEQTVSPDALSLLREWRELIDQGIEACLSVATADTEKGAQLRQSSPIGFVLTLQERRSVRKRWSHLYDA